MKKYLMIAAALMLAPLPALAQAGGSRTPTAAIDDFHTALAAGDNAAVQALLTPDLVVYEFGVIDVSADAYVTQLLPIDEKLVATSTWDLIDRQLGGEDDIRWVLTKYHVTGTDSTGAPFDQQVLETVVLTRSNNLFQISHFHWSTDNTAYQAGAQSERMAAIAAAGGDAEGGTPAPAAP